MIRKIVIAILCCAASGIYAQNSSASPYSFFGIGELRSSGTVENRMMGGISVFADSIHINLQNPAAYSKLLLTTYSAGISHSEINLESATAAERTRITNLEYLSLGFRLRKNLGLGLGVAPFSSVGYNIVSQSANANNATVTNAFSGDGGLNRVYASLGYQVTKNLSLGATANFNFGTLRANRIQSVENVQFGTLDRRESRVNGLAFDFGANYVLPLKKNLNFHGSVVVSTQANLTSENSQEIGSFEQIAGAEIEVVEVDLAAAGLRNTDLKIPTTTTLGLGIGKTRKWFVGAEYSFQQLSDFSNDFLAVSNFRFDDASSFAIGGFYIPNYSTFTGYFKRVTYRLGARVSKSGMIVNDTEINDFGITFGVGLPLGRGFSNINLGFEVGNRGTTDANLIKESYFNVNLGISLNDSFWFQKRKLN
ncbi:hypothetical protein [Spongiimicrobium salis]|uniref:hypothetical protein n=1 Tax=Spongiimicrobium salis TaxID=1667022 RepID=UPI00374D5399